MRRRFIRASVAALAFSIAGSLFAQGEQELPPGHPPTQALPQGHPPVGRAGSASGLFEPLPDSVTDDESIAKGTVIVSLLDESGKPLAEAEGVLVVSNNSVTKGESVERRSKKSDANGQLTFDNLRTGSGVTYRIVVNRGAASFTSESFGLGLQSGKKVVLHAYEASRDIEDTLVGMYGVAYLELKEDSILVQNRYTIMNLGKVAWLPDVSLTLPADFKAVVVGESEGPVRAAEVKGKGVKIIGTVPPGKHEVTFNYQVPLKGETLQNFKATLPPRVAGMRVMAEVNKEMALEVAGFPPARKSENQAGQRIALAEMAAGRTGISSIDVTLTGLPTPGIGRSVATAIAAVLIAGSLAFAVRRKPKELSPEQKADLVSARDALMRDLVALERAHKKGVIGPKSYEQLRPQLVDALARIIAMIEGSPSLGATELTNTVATQ